MGLRFEADRPGLGKPSPTPHSRTTGLSGTNREKGAWDRGAFRIDYEWAARTPKRQGNVETREEAKSVIPVTGPTGNSGWHIAFHLLRTGARTAAPAGGLEERIDPATSQIALELAA
jgi:hypothetical protein